MMPPLSQQARPWEGPDYEAAVAVFKSLGIPLPSYMVAPGGSATPWQGTQATSAPAQAAPPAQPRQPAPLSPGSWEFGGPATDDQLAALGGNWQGSVGGNPAPAAPTAPPSAPPTPIAGPPQPFDFLDPFAALNGPGSAAPAPWQGTQAPTGQPPLQPSGAPPGTPGSAFYGPPAPTSPAVNNTSTEFDAAAREVLGGAVQPGGAQPRTPAAPTQPTQPTQGTQPDPTAVGQKTTSPDGVPLISVRIGTSPVGAPIYGWEVDNTLYPPGKPKGPAFGDHGAVKSSSTTRVQRDGKWYKVTTKTYEDTFSENVEEEEPPVKAGERTELWSTTEEETDSTGKKWSVTKRRFSDGSEQVSKTQITKTQTEEFTETIGTTKGADGKTYTTVVRTYKDGRTQTFIKDEANQEVKTLSYTKTNADGSEDFVIYKTENGVPVGQPIFTQRVKEATATKRRTLPTGWPQQWNDEQTGEIKAWNEEKGDYDVIGTIPGWESSEMKLQKQKLQWEKDETERSRQEERQKWEYLHPTRQNLARQNPALARALGEAGTLSRQTYDALGPEDKQAFQNMIAAGEVQAPWWWMGSNNTLGPGPAAQSWQGQTARRQY